jgi:hypothetical protein
LPSIQRFLPPQTMPHRAVYEQHAKVLSRYFFKNENHKRKKKSNMFVKAK